jgi:hypothetical protein
MNKIIINDFAPLADKYATLPAEGSTEFQNAGKLLDETARKIVNYASLEGKGINLLDSSLVFADENDNIGYISSECSDNLGEFNSASKIVIELSEGLYSAPGITLHFWQHFCRDVTVQWYRDSEMISSKKFFPDSLDFFGENAVENFNRIVILLNQTEIPYQFIKLAGIDLGRTREITDLISNIEIFTEINPDCADVPGSTCDFVACISEFKPQDMQELYVYGGKEEKLFGKYIIDRVPSVGRNIYSFECSDEIMKMNSPVYPQKPQSTYKISELNAEIKSASNVNIECETFNDTEVVGFVEKDKSVRLAAAMMSFSLGCFLTGFNSKYLRMIKPKNRRDKIISSDQILGKAEYLIKAPYTEIIMNQYSGQFDDAVDSRRISLGNKKATESINPLAFDKYSLMTDIDKMMNRAVEAGFRRNEITARILYDDESLGDICAIETPYDGIKTGIITAMNISAGHRITATIKMIERDFSSEGDEL